VGLKKRKIIDEEFMNDEEFTSLTPEERRKQFKRFINEKT